MIPILELLPTVYFWLYVGLGAAFLMQSIASMAPAAPPNPALAGVGLVEASPAARTPRLLPTLIAGLLAASLATHLLHFVMRWTINGHAPLQSKHEVFTATGLTTMIFTLVLYLSEKVWRTRGAGAVLGNLVFVLLTGLGGILWTALGMREDYKVANLVPALQSAWHPPHVSAYMLGYGSLGLASLLALFYLLGAAGNKLFGGRVPLFRALASPLVDRWTYKIAGLGFPFMTAALCMGALWADASWGEYWFWDAKETWALISWAVFVVYFHLRFLKGWVGLRAQVVVLLGGVMIWITYMMIHVLPASQASLHVYN